MTSDGHEIISNVPSAQELAEQAGIRTERLGAEPLTIEPGQVLVPKDQAIQQYGLNGDILGVITLPKGAGEEVAKDIAIVDFGQIKEGEKQPIHILHGQGMGHATGYAKSRYGLYPLNYSSEAPFHAELHPQSSLVLGTSDLRHNKALGLSYGEPGSDMISEGHLTIELSDEGAIDILDHSTHGTVVKYRTKSKDQETETQRPIPLAERSTEEALSLITRAIGDLMQRRLDYYQNYDPKSPQESRRTKIERELSALRVALENGATPGVYNEVELFSGNQSRDVDSGRENLNNAVLEDLYATLSDLAGMGIKDYYDIGEDAKAAKAANNIVPANYAGKYLMEMPVMALTSSRNELFGVQLRLTPNIYASFTAENLFDADRPHQAEVRLAVVAK